MVVCVDTVVNVVIVALVAMGVPAEAVPIEGVAFIVVAVPITPGVVD